MPSAKCQVLGARSHGAASLRLRLPHLAVIWASRRQSADLWNHMYFKNVPKKGDFMKKKKEDKHPVCWWLWYQYQCKRIVTASYSCIIGTGTSTGVWLSDYGVKCIGVYCSRVNLKCSIIQVQCSALQFIPEQCSAVLYGAAMCIAIHCSLCSYVKCSTVQRSTVQCSAVQFSSLHLCSVLCITVQCSAVLFKCVQCSAMQCTAVLEEVFLWCQEIPFKYVLIRSCTVLWSSDWVFATQGKVGP